MGIKLCAMTNQPLSVAKYVRPKRSANSAQVERLAPSEQATKKTKELIPSRL